MLAKWSGRRDSNSRPPAPVGCEFQFIAQIRENSRTCQAQYFGYDDSVMRDLAILFIHMFVTIARLLGPGGARSVVAESLLVKNQLLLLSRSRARAPDLRPSDRIIVGLCAIFMRPTRLLRSAIVLKPSTILSFHRSLVKRKYRLLFAPKNRGKPGVPSINSSSSKLRRQSCVFVVQSPDSPNTDYLSFIRRFLHSVIGRILIE